MSDQEVEVCQEEVNPEPLGTNSPIYIGSNPTQDARQSFNRRTGGAPGSSQMQATRSSQVHRPKHFLSKYRFWLIICCFVWLLFININWNSEFTDFPALIRDYFVTMYDIFAHAVLPRYLRFENSTANYDF